LGVPLLPSKRLQKGRAMRGYRPSWSTDHSEPPIVTSRATTIPHAGPPRINQTSINKKAEGATCRCLILVDRFYE